jgi:Zn-dependent protease with chaperone function
MSSPAIQLPSRKWSIVALGSAGMAAVILSYLFAIGVALACFALPVVMFVYFPMGSANGIVYRLLLSAFGIVAGGTVLWSLIPQKNKVDINGVLIDLKREKRLGNEIEAIAAALDEPMPSEVYLLGEANAFVIETGANGGKRRIIGLGLPLLQMLTIAQFRAVLAHEFGHYYAGDTRLGPWVYNARRTIARVYENLGRKSDVLRFLRRWAIVSGAYMLLMGAMRTYWNFFMRVTRSISRRQEYRSDELACHVAGSQALIEGLENIPRCQSVLNAYWTSVVLPVAANGYQPRLADGFMRFMNAPHVAKATEEYLAKRSAEEKSSPMDTHPPLNKRIERARLYNLPAPKVAGQAAETELPMISLIDELPALEGNLLKKFVPSLAQAELKTLAWESAGMEVYVPLWRKQVANHLDLLATKMLNDLPALVKDPRAISSRIPDPKGKTLNPAQREAKALDVLYCAVALCLVDNGWTVVSQPGTLHLECGEQKLEPGAVIAALKAGKFEAEVEWASTCTKGGMNEWTLASTSGVPMS